MANKAKAKAATKRTSAPAAPVAGNTTATSPTTKAATKANPAAPKAALFTLGTWAPPQASSIRAYARAVAVALGTANPAGFTLAAYKAALVANAAASTMRQPTGGWAGHNMPTWAANPRQAWLVPATAAKG